MSRSVEDFLANLVKSGLCSRREIEALLAEQGMRSLESRAEELAQRLIERGTLTPLQASQILKGKPEGLVLRDYELLSLLGQGAWDGSTRPGIVGWTGLWLKGYWSAGWVGIRRREPALNARRGRRVG
ncbi:MAG TPA: hypothetical protein EYP14_03105 [Planctomycetaceae bacterium]|nr:hypothetical protein [Planctomycetaceae bacterium]